MTQDYIDFCNEYNLNPNLAMSLGIYYAIKDKYYNKNKVLKKDYINRK